MKIYLKNIKNIKNSIENILISYKNESFWKKNTEYFNAKNMKNDYFESKIIYKK